MRIVPIDVWRTAPWKNGGGITHELWRDREGDAFDLRLSIAEIAQPGPFSQFPGVDRVITLLEGRGFRLTAEDGRSVTVDAPAAPFAFRGDDAWTCTLVDGPVRDFNVMSARARPVAVVAVDGDARLPGPAFVLALDAISVNGSPLRRWELAVPEPDEPTRVTGRALLVIQSNRAP